MIRRSLLGQKPKQMLSDQKANPYRRVRRKPTDLGGEDLEAVKAQQPGG